ncbi:MAG: glycosyltransferase family 4 protein [Desulfuromonadales bacterium]|nr:glycosyltransferase family 4 protein [Desulfuromonadales bacterium]
MRLLFVFPFCSPEVNSISGGPLYLASAGHAILIITARHAFSLKGEVSAPESAVVDQAEFWRPYAESRDLRADPFRLWKAVARKAKQFRPDAVVCFGEFNYRLAVRLSRHLGVPLIFYMEYLRPEKIAHPIRGKRLLARYAPSLDRLASKVFLRYLARRARGIMFAYAGDQPYVSAVERFGTRVFYVPWCTEVPNFAEPVERQRRSGIYIGSLEGFKNAAELVKAVPLLLDDTPTERFVVVGPGAYAAQVQSLADRYGGRLTYIPSVPRAEAMRLLRISGYGFTPVQDCGLGFIGDCWATGTPLVMTHELDGFVKRGCDTLVADGLEDLPRVVGELLGSDELSRNCSREGRLRYEANYTGKAVGERYLEVIRTCLGYTNSINDGARSPAESMGQKQGDVRC